jgi:predicted cupin superfamily sugar epimerase
VLTLHDDGTHTLAVLGSDLRVGQRVQLFIPGSTFHTARIIGQRRWFLGASTEWPGVVPTEDVELGDAEALAASHPDVAAEIRSFPLPAS